jgi:L-lactate dehydrogenase complex protein LldG
VTATRESILAAVRAALGGERRDPAAIAAEAAGLLRDPDLIRPHLPEASLVDLFAERVSHPRVGATVERVGDMSELPAAVRRYLEAHGLPNAVALQPAPDLQRLDWSGIELHAAMAPDEAAGVGLAEYGIAEGGTLVFRSGPDTPILYNFLPLHHLVALRAGTILAHLEDYAALASGEPPPRNLNLITGASGTTDIEGRYVRGAHGPGYLHVVIVEEGRGASDELNARPAGL